MPTKKIAINIDIKNIKKVADLKKELKDLRKEQTEYEKYAKKGKFTSKEMEKQYLANARSIKAKSTALRNLNKNLQTSTTNTTKTTKATGSLSKSFIKAGAALGIMITAFRAINRMLSGIVRTFTEFEFVMAKVQAVSGATTEQFKALSDSAEKLGRETFFTAEQVGQLQLNYSKLGFTADEIMKAQRATLDLAVATGSDLARAAIVAGAAVRGFGLDAGETERVVDVMAVAFSSSALDIEKWQTAMTKVAPIAKAAGFEIEEVTAILAKLTDAGIEASIAGTSLRNIFLKMQDPTSNLSKTFGGTIHSLEELIPAMKKFVDEGGNMADIMEVVDLRQAAAFEQMLSSSDDIMVLYEALKNANGEGERMALMVGDTLHGAFLKSKSALQGLSIAIMKNYGTALKKSLERFAKWLNGLAENEDRLGRFLKNLKLLITLIASYKIGVVVATRATALYAVAMKGASVSAGLLTTATRIAAVAMRGLAAAIASTGIGLVVVAIGTLVSGLMRMNSGVNDAINWQDKMTDAFSDTKVQLGILDIEYQNIIKSKKILNDLTDDEGKLLNDTAENQYRLAQANKDLSKAVNILNAGLKSNNLELIDAESNLDDVATAYKNLTNAIKEAAIADIYQDTLKEITRTRVQADVLFADFITQLDRFGIDKSTPELENIVLEIIKKYETSGFALTKGIGGFIENFYGAIGDLVGIDFLPLPEVHKMEKHLQTMLDKYDMSLGEFIEALTNPNYIADKEKLVKESLKQHLPEGFNSIDEFILSLVAGDDPQGGGGGGGVTGTPAETAPQWKINFEKRLRDLIHAYSNGLEIMIELQDGSQERMLLSKAAFDEEIIKANIKSLQEQEQYLKDKATMAEANADELHLKELERQRKLEEELLKLKKHYLQKTTDELKLEKDRLNNQEEENFAKGLHSQATLNIAKLENERYFLQQRLALYDTHSEDWQKISNQIANVDNQLLKERSNMWKKELGSMSLLGQVLQDFAGDNEELNKVRKVGIKLTQLATLAQALLNLQTELAGLAQKKKALATLQAAAADGAGIGPAIGLMLAEFGLAGASAAAGVTKQSKLFFPWNLIAMFGTLAAIVSVIIALKSLFAGTGIDNLGSGSSLAGVTGTGGEVTNPNDMFIRTYAKGGMVEGDSHAEGGEKFAVGGRVVELEGGEAVINKRSTSMFRNQLSAMNQVGGGVQFADGGLLNMPSFTQTAFNALNTGQSGTQKVVVVEADITDSQNTVNLIESEATI